MNNAAKVMFLLFLFLYILSPIDLMPGCLIDDGILALLGVVAMQKGSIIKPNS